MKRSIAVVAIGVSAALAQAGAWDNEWRMKEGSRPDHVRFTIERTNQGHHWKQTSDVPLTTFRGLPSDVLNQRGQVKFELVRDAGRLACIGHFGNGLGIGTFEFVANSEFGSQLQSLGFERPDYDDAFSMTMSDVSLAFAKSVRDAGVSSTTKQLLEMRIHGITSEYISEFRKAGFSLNARELVELRIHGVSPAFVEEAHAYGMRPTSRELVEMRIHGVSTDLIQTARQLGYRFTPREFTQMRIHGVNGAYLKKLKDAGFQHLSADKIVKLRIHGVD